MYGLDTFAHSIAQSIRLSVRPEGTTIAINGAWGSGKSSAINLCVNHLQNEVDAGSIVIVRFNCWWFRGEEALALAFFRELRAALQPTLSAKAAEILPKLGANLLKAGSVVSPALNLFGLGGAGSMAAGTMNWLSGMIDEGDSVETLHQALADALRQSDKRLLVVIDDIDRLSPDEALLIFRLVKSVGRLPNILYLLAYDREIAEQVVTEHYPSEGPHYLEKIVQAAFDLPAPARTDLNKACLKQVERICGAPPQEQHTHILNLFHEVIAPEIQTPRDVLRFANALTITWPAIGSEVDLGDYLAIEALRLFQPEIFRAVRGNRSIVCNIPSERARREELSSQYDDALLAKVDAMEKPRMKRVLMRLFPPLEAVWSNVWHSSSSGRWAAQRRVCSSAHFDTYFRFSLSDDAAPRSDIASLIAEPSNTSLIHDMFRQAVNTIRGNGTTRAAVLLDELNVNASRFSDEAVLPFLTNLFQIADEVDVPQDRERGFEITGNNLRFHWLLRALTIERFSIEERSDLIRTACETASLAWLVDLTTSAHGQHQEREDRDPVREEDRLMTLADAQSLREFTLGKIRDAAGSGALLEANRLSYILYRWRDFAGDAEHEVREWASEQLSDDQSVAKFAHSFMSTSWGQGFGFNGLGDLVATPSDQVPTSGLDDVLDEQRFRERLEELEASTAISAEEQEIVSRYLAAWRAQDRGSDD
ncbi:P-loop NTPase fold protein [Maricaulis sp.]|uniref:KAP family P-loop NTPase fold protein n=1 Tax=Maricaulis sp. TaxID=1486257 RepID=UPI002639A2AA|nr:P-loop NTPase fold protein [Maricaulis sp.]